SRDSTSARSLIAPSRVSVNPPSTTPSPMTTENAYASRVPILRFLNQFIIADVSPAVAGSIATLRIDGAPWIHHEQQAALELVGAADQLARGIAERLGRPLEGVLVNLDHVADVVDQQADRPVGRAHHDVE